MSDAANDALPTLHALRGERVSADFLDRWRRALTLPASARAGLWDLLGPSLMDPTPDDMPQRVQAFCSTHQADPESLGIALEASHRLLHHATLAEIDAGAFAQDVRALSEGEEPLGTLLAQAFEPATQTIRSLLMNRTVQDHGPVITGLSWRIQRLASSDMLPISDIPIVSLAFRTLDGGEEKRFTTQATLEGIRELRDTFDVILSRVTVEEE